MSTDPTNRPDPNEAELLRRVLEEPGAGWRDAPDADTGRRAAELERFVRRCREVLAPELSAEPGDPALVERVLDATVREDLGVRGDLRLLGRHARERLRSSPLTRFVAASLVLHLFTLPVLAWLAWRPAPAQPVLTVRIEIPDGEQALPAVPNEPGPDLDFEPDGEPELVEVDPAPALAAEVRRARREDRARLGAIELAPTPGGGSGPEADWLQRVLAARERLLRSREVDALWDAAPPLEEDPLVLALWVEGALDLALWRERAPGGLERALVELAALPADDGTARGRLLGHARARAARYGLTGDGAPVAETEPDGPAGPRWRADLLEALDAAGRPVPAAEAWRRP